jgi:YHS domain-containing protein
LVDLFPWELDWSLGAFFFLASGLHLKMMGLNFLANRGFNESFSTRHTFESAVYDEGVYFFCSKECMDMWMSVNAQEIELENQQQPST